MSVHYVAHGEKALKFEGRDSKKRAQRYASRVRIEPQRRLIERRDIKYASNFPERTP